MLLTVQEVIVVEGEHDRARVLLAVQADVIVTGGSRIKKEVYARLGRIADTRGIIILTDPDYAGEQIRRQIAARFPKSKHAYIAKSAAEACGDIGVENARPEDIAEALLQVRTVWDQPQEEFAWEDLLANGLAGTPQAAQRRERMGAILRIGYGNAKAFLKRLNALQVTRAEFSAAAAAMELGKDAK